MAMLRSLVIGQIGSAGHKAVIDEAKKRFAAHCDGSAELPADLRSAVSSYPSSPSVAAAAALHQIARMLLA